MQGKRALVLIAVTAIATVGYTCQAAASSRLWSVVYASPKRGHDMDRIQRGGVRSVRWPLFWSLAEPAQGTFDWNAADRIVGGFALRGIRVLPTVYNTPSWAGKTAASPPVRSKHARSAWKKFLREAVQRYGPGGQFWTLYKVQHPGAPIVPIRAWQVWNEPNLDQYFAPHPSARRYGRLVRISHDAIKGRDPGARIVLAGMPGLAKLRAWKFLRRLYRVPHIKREFDEVALHPYSPNIRLLRLEFRRMRAVMSSHGDGSTQLWATELGWGSGSPRRSDLNKGLHGQARMLRKSFEVIRHHRRQWHVAHVYWFQWRDPERDSPECPFCKRTGLIKHSGKAKPSWRAFRHFTGALH